MVFSAADIKEECHGAFDGMARVGYAGKAVMEVIELAVLSKMEGINILGNCLTVYGGRRNENVR